MDGGEGEIEAADEEEGETPSQAHAQRVSAIKWLMEHVSVLIFPSKLCIVSGYGLLYIHVRAECCNDLNCFS